MVTDREKKSEPSENEREKTQPACHVSHLAPPTTHLHGWQRWTEEPRPEPLSGERRFPSLRKEEPTLTPAVSVMWLHNLERLSTVYWYIGGCEGAADVRTAVPFKLYLHGIVLEESKPEESKGTRKL